MDERVCSIFKPEQVAYFQQVIGRLKEGGCGAIIPAAPRFLSS